MSEHNAIRLARAARNWLPEDWHPDAFDVDEVNEDPASLVDG